MVALRQETEGLVNPTLPSPMLQPCEVWDQDLFEFVHRRNNGVSSSMSEWFFSPRITPMAPLMVDPAGCLKFSCVSGRCPSTTVEARVRP